MKIRVHRTIATPAACANNRDEASLHSRSARPRSRSQLAPTLSSTRSLSLANPDAHCQSQFQGSKTNMKSIVHLAAAFAMTGTPWAWATTTFTHQD